MITEKNTGSTYGMITGMDYDRGDKMIIRTFWVLHEGEDTPECTVAWDEGAIAVTPEAWEQAKQVNLDLYGLRAENAREIRIKVDDRKILAAFESDSITGEVL